MEINDFIEAINKVINPEKGVLVLHRHVQEHPKFKAFMIFTYSLYNIIGEKSCIHNIEFARNISYKDIAEVWEEINKEYLKELVHFIDSENFNQLKNV